MNCSQHKRQPHKETQRNIKVQCKYKRLIVDQYFLFGYYFIICLCVCMCMYIRYMLYTFSHLQTVYNGLNSNDSNNNNDSTFFIFKALFTVQNFKVWQMKSKLSKTHCKSTQLKPSPPFNTKKSLYLNVRPTVVESLVFGFLVFGKRDAAEPFTITDWSPKTKSPREIARTKDEKYAHRLTVANVSTNQTETTCSSWTVLAK